MPVGSDSWQLECLYHNITWPGCRFNQLLLFQIPKKRMKKKMSPRSSPDDNDSDLDLSKDLQPIGTFLKDRTRLISEMFAALKPKKIRNLLPEILKVFSILSWNWDNNDLNDFHESDSGFSDVFCPEHPKYVQSS